MTRLIIGLDGALIAVRINGRGSVQPDDLRVEREPEHCLGLKCRTKLRVDFLINWSADHCADPRVKHRSDAWTGRWFRRTPVPTSYCEERMLESSDESMAYGTLCCMLFGVEWDPEHYFQVTVSLSWQQHSAFAEMADASKDAWRILRREAKAVSTT